VGPNFGFTVVTLAVENNKSAWWLEGMKLGKSCCGR
jgi:hypothetical protein